MARINGLIFVYLKFLRINYDLDAVWIAGAIILREYLYRRSASVAVCTSPI